MVINNKQGWTSVIEVFVSILLIAGIIAIVINSNVIQKPKIGEQIYKSQALTLKIIQMDDGLRVDVLGGQISVGVNNTISQTIPNYLECKSKICNFQSECNLDSEAIPDKEVYAKSILITADMANYSPKELKLFCWEK